MDDRLERNTHSEVQRYYGETLESSGDLKTTACCTAAAPPDYISRILAEIHEEVSRRYYGCGLVLPEALEGLRALDLGCGAGRDVYLLSRLVGPDGHVTGVDMTPEQLEVAKAHREFHRDRYGYERSNVEFIAGNIEELDACGLPDASFDLIVSNCVINLAVDKAAVLKSAFALLKPGGEMYFSDIYANRRVPEELTRDPVLYGECLAGALYWNDFTALARSCGFAGPYVVEESAVDITDPGLSERVGDLRFRSVTVRLMRTDGLEASDEDYGQQAVYAGSIPGHEDEFLLDRNNRFTAGQPKPVSGNTARVLESGRLAAHFEILGDNRTHFGPFSDNSDSPSFTKDGKEKPSGGCC
jgi:SAM-dependent methyltransferase